MRMSRIVAALIAAAAVQLPPLVVDAQVPFYTLPKDDFIWNWGDSVAERDQRGVADLEVSGSESFFLCDLTARMKPGSSRSTTDMREIESGLRTRLDFI